MYFPYLRGKQFELIMLKELADKVSDSGNVIPIIEPVKKRLSTVASVLKKYKEKKSKFIIVANPAVGELKNNVKAIFDDLITPEYNGYDQGIVGFLISNYTTLSDVKKFVKIASAYKICFIFGSTSIPFADIEKVIDGIDSYEYSIFINEKTSRSYRRNFIKEYDCVLIEDGFEKQNNAHYALQPDHYFSDLNSVYLEDGFMGFGDYLIVGEEFTEGGGPAHAVAIHLTYLHKEGDIWIKHFVSDSNGTPVDPAGKFLEALNKLVTYVKKKEVDFSFSTACDEFIELHKNQYYPGLGSVKKLCMKHHVELMISII